MESHEKAQPRSDATSLQESAFARVLRKRSGLWVVVGGGGGCFLGGGGGHIPSARPREPSGIKHQGNYYGATHIGELSRR